MHWLDWVQAPASVLVVWSKISIALAVPVMLAVAVAVRTALSPAGRKLTAAVRSKRCSIRSGRSAEMGTLGVIWGGASESPPFATFTVGATARRMSAHAAGLVGTGSSEGVGEGGWAAGVDAVPGFPAGAMPPLLHAAPGPEAGHCWEPAGTLTLASPAAPMDMHPELAVSAPDAQAAAPCLTACIVRRISPAGGAAANAAMVTWWPLTTNTASSRCAFARFLKPRTNRRSRCNKNLLELIGALRAPGGDRPARRRK